MNNKFELIRDDFFSYENKDNYKKVNIEDFAKSYLINADDTIYFGDECGKSYSSIVYCYCTFTKKDASLVITIELQAWSNDNNSYVSLEQSVWAKDFDEGKYIISIFNHYKPITSKLLAYFNNFKYFWNYKELFYHFENPTKIFHYKLLNTFTLEELETLCQKFDFKEPILNTALLKSESDISRWISNLFLPHYCDGFYIADIGIEISVDLKSDDVAVIEDNDIGVISKIKLFERLALIR